VRPARRARHLAALLAAGRIAVASMLLALAACSRDAGLTAASSTDDAAAHAGAAGSGAAGAGAGGSAEPAGGAGIGEPPDLAHANLVLISIDTLRADATQMLGGPEGITPALAEFASHAVLFTAARATAPQTAPSHMSVFTGTYPSVHGVENVGHGAGADGSEKLETVPLPSDIPTLAEILAAAGLRCIGRTEGGNLLPAHGFSRGFSDYTFELVGVEEQVTRGLDTLRELTAPGAGRFFLFWHTYQCHAPYVPPASYIERWAPADYDGLMKPRIAELGSKSFKERFNSMKTLFWKDRESFGAEEARYLHGLYLGGVDYADDQLARLFAGMAEQGVFRNSVVVVMSDHGEAFFEHGHWQHEDVHEECLRVPLAIRFPGDWQAGARLATPVGLIDLFPTLLDLLRVDTAAIAEKLPGRVRRSTQSLAADVLAGREPRALPVISEYDATLGGNLDKQVAIEANGMKFIYDEVRGERLPSGGSQQLRYLYDLRKDPGETVNLASQGGPALKAFLAHYAGLQTVRKLEKSATSGQAQTIPDENRGMLEALGYIDAANEPAGSTPNAPENVPANALPKKPAKKPASPPAEELPATSSEEEPSALPKSSPDGALPRSPSRTRSRS